jgi:thiamine-phosphate pyrophosphorylase
VKSKLVISRLHYITQVLPGFSHAQLAQFACKGGADWIQLRMKHSIPLGERAQYEEWIKTAEATKAICRKYGAKLIINDHVQIAKEVGADGVHLGKDDMSPKEARTLLGDDFIIGGSTNSLEDVKKRIEEGCNYIGIGPFRFTSTKDKLNPVLGLEGIRSIVENSGNQLPMIAIGGINFEDIKPLMQTGVYGVAVASAINRVEDKSRMTVKFNQALRQFSRLNS